MRTFLLCVLLAVSSTALGFYGARWLVGPPTVTALILIKKDGGEALDGVVVIDSTGDYIILIGDELNASSITDLKGFLEQGAKGGSLYYSCPAETFTDSDARVGSGSQYGVLLAR